MSKVRWSYDEDEQTVVLALPKGEKKVPYIEKYAYEEFRLRVRELGIIKAIEYLIKISRGTE